MTFLFEPAILENPRILTVSVRIPSGCTIDVIFNVTLLIDAIQGEVEGRKAYGIITSMIFISTADLASYDT